LEKKKVLERGGLVVRNQKQTALVGKEDAREGTLIQLRAAWAGGEREEVVDQQNGNRWEDSNNFGVTSSNVWLPRKVRNAHF